jgi:DNA invertase Pin-like site-specific DNA recombinase
MSELPKVTERHRQRRAVVYVRQSTPGQVERNTELAARQYALAERAVELGWPVASVLVVDEDTGLSGPWARARIGFRELAAEVGLGHVGVILALEVSRLARSSADWHQLLDLRALTGTLIADADGIYSPADFNDRLLLGLKGPMSEAELHLIRSRLRGGLEREQGGARGELRLPLPIGWSAMRWARSACALMSRCAARSAAYSSCGIGAARGGRSWPSWPPRGSASRAGESPSAGSGGSRPTMALCTRS